MEENIVKFGEMIELKGFESLDPGTMQILKKLIGNQANSLIEADNVEKLKLILRENSSKKCRVAGELHSNGAITHSDISNTNLFMGISKVLEELKNVKK